MTLKQTRQLMPLSEFLDLVGKFEAQSDWLTITQDMIDRFADITLDHQFIHIDPERARAETPFGGTIAHGFLTLSMLSALAVDCIPRPLETAMGINYGFDKIRFLSPVPAGARIRGRFKLAESGERKPRELLSRYEVTVDIEGSDTPALAASWLSVVILNAPFKEILGDNS